LDYWLLDNKNPMEISKLLWETIKNVSEKEKAVPQIDRFFLTNVTIVSW
jgi:hypothetical protein